MLSPILIIILVACDSLHFAFIHLGSVGIGTLVSIAFLPMNAFDVVYEFHHEGVLHALRTHYFLRRFFSGVCFGIFSFVIAL